MRNYFNIELSQENKSSILLAGGNPLIRPLISFLSRDFRLFLYTNKAQTEYFEDQKVIQLTEKSIHRIATIRIDYAILFLDSDNDKKTIFLIVNSFCKTFDKVLIVVNIHTIANNPDILVSYKKNKKISFLILGDLFGTNIPISYSQISKFINMAIRTETATLSGNDLFPIFPISDIDAIQGILQILFGHQRNDVIYCQFYEHPQTYISLVNLLKDMNQNLEISFTKQGIHAEENESWDSIKKILLKQVNSIHLVKADMLGFQKSIQALKKSLTSKTVSEVVKNEEMLKTPQERKRFSTRRKIFSLFAAVTIHIGLILFMTFASMFLFSKGIEDFQRNHFQKSKDFIGKSHFFLSVSDMPLSIILDLVSLLTKRGDLNIRYQSFKTISYLANEISNNVNKAMKNRNNFSTDELINFIANINQGYFSLERLRVEDKDLEQKLFEVVKHQHFDNLIAVAQSFPEVLGYNGQKKYLLLFQNNAELRPTGGFIGSIGELSLSNGKIENFAIKDVYDLDGQLKAHVEPHYVIRRFLQPHLYLRDSNFSPDFEKSASYSALLYHLETNNQVDGVVAVDFEVLKEIIKIVGPIKLDDYRQILDENNALNFIQSTIEKNSFPGSTQKKDLLQAVLNQISFKIADNPDNLFKIAKLVPKLIFDKHILFAFTDANLQSIFTISGMSGTQRDLREKKENTLYDYLSFNEANIGVNKANQRIERKVEYEVSLDQKSISKARLILTNGNKSVPYIAYFRIFTPLGSRLENVIIDNNQMRIMPAVTDFRKYEDKKFKPPDGFEVDSQVEDDHQVFGFIMDVPENQTRTIEVNYQNGMNLPSSEKLSYDLFYVKQLGTSDFPIDVSVKYPEGYIVKEARDGEIEKDSVVVKKIISSDTDFSASFEKK